MNSMESPKKEAQIAAPTTTDPTPSISLLNLIYLHNFYYHEPQEYFHMLEHPPGTTTHDGSTCRVHTTQTRIPSSLVCKEQ